MEKVNKFAIGIPTLNRFDLLHPALLFYIRDYPNTKIYIVDNGEQKISEKITHPNIEILHCGANLGVSASWNLMCRKIFEENDYALILNDDIYLGRKEWEIDNLLTNFKRFFYVTTQDWCAFILPKTTFEAIGDFDEGFYPAYYEDNDYTYRIKLYGQYPYRIPFLNPFVYTNSSTSHKQPSILTHVPHNKQRYIDKWGGEPTKEKFKKPFNK